MRLLILLLLIGTLAKAQSTTKIKENSSFFKASIQTRVRDQVVDCQVRYIEYFFSKRRIVIKSDSWSIDLKIKKREEYRWRGVSSDGIWYTVYIASYQGKDGFAFEPDDGSVGAIVIRGANICQ